MSKVSMPALNYLSGKSKTAEYPASGPTEALLTNKPTQGIMQGLARSSPAMAGAMAAAPEGAALGAVAGTAIFPGVGTAVGGIVGGLGAAAIGGIAGESARNAAANTVATALPRKNYPVLNSSQFLQKLNLAGKEQAQNEAFGLAAGGALKQGASAVSNFVADRLPAGISKYVGIPESITKYVQGRGTKNVLNSGNLSEGAAMTNVGKATSDLSELRSSVGQSVGDAEQEVLGTVGPRPASVDKIGNDLEKALFSRGITDPKTAPLARGKEVSILNKLVETLKPSESLFSDPAGLGVTKSTVENGITIRQALNAKRLIDENLEFADKELSKPTEALLKRVNHQIRVAVRADLGPGVSKLWDQFGTIADAQDKLSEFTGTRALSNVQQRAVQSLKLMIQKNPKEVDSIVQILGEGLPGGQNQARQIFDSIAATPFTKGGIGAPSNIILKGAAALGLTGGSAAKNALRASEGLSNFAARPASVPRKTVFPALEALRRMRDQNGEP